MLEFKDKKTKKATKKHEGNLPRATDSQGVKFEDISQKVDAPKRSASPAEPLEQAKTKKAKKAKKKHEGNLPQATDSQGFEFEDI